jgi:hypothetical protein
MQAAAHLEQRAGQHGDHDDREQDGQDGHHRPPNPSVSAFM